MLSNIKSMIKEKTEFLEAAGLIYEDGSVNLDDFIVLGEETEGDAAGAEISETKEKPEEDIDDDDKDDEEDDPKEDEDEKEDKSDKGDPAGDNLMDAPIDGEDDKDDEVPISDGPSEGDGILDADIGEEPMPLPGDDLPTPVGAQTGEPINPFDDFLNVEIDLGTNTVKDVLPVPPANAVDTMPGDTLEQHVDSGFGQEGFSESAKEKSPDFSIYGVKFTVPDRVTKFIDYHSKEKLTDEIADKARDAMLKMVNNRKNLKAIEKDILEEQKQIGADSDTDKDRIETIKKYLGGANVGKFLCTADGSGSVLNIHMKFIKGIENAWLEHELWITSDGHAIPYDVVETYKQPSKAVKESTHYDSYYDLFDEAITIGDEPPAADTKADNTASEEPPAEAEEAPADDGAAEDSESEVTAAVRDKVSEVDTPAPGGEGASSKEDLLKKLGNITKSLEDAKKAVMNTIQ